MVGGAYSLRREAEEEPRSENNKKTKKIVKTNPPTPEPAEGISACEFTKGTLIPCRKEERRLFLRPGLRALVSTGDARSGRLDG